MPHTEGTKHCLCHKVSSQLKQTQSTAQEQQIKLDQKLFDPSGDSRSLIESKYIFRIKKETKING